jgi:hypothetical protein
MEWEEKTLPLPSLTTPFDAYSREQTQSAQLRHIVLATYSLRKVADPLTMEADSAMTRLGMGVTWL